MGKRICHVVAYVICMPLFICTVVLCALPIPLIALGIYIVKGDKHDKLMDFIFYPMEFVIMLPDNIIDFIFKK